MDLPTGLPWPMVVALAGGAVWCLWHARRIDVAETPERLAERRRWIVAGLLFTGLAIGLACLLAASFRPLLRRH
jgi:hypothetical protein